MTATPHASPGPADVVAAHRLIKDLLAPRPWCYWRELLLSLKQRGLSGVSLAISDDYPRLKPAVAEVLPEACWRRHYIHDPPTPWTPFPACRR